MPRKPLNEIDRKIGANIRRHRIARRQTQRALAAVMDTSYQHLQMYERAERRISAVRLFLVCRALNVSIDAMFD